MKYALLAFTLFISPAIAEEESSFRERVAYAKRVVALESPRTALENTSNKVKEHPAYPAIMSRMDFDFLEREAAEFMATQFTLKEIKALFAFQNSPEGRAIAKKMNAYKAAVGLTTHREMNKVVRQMQKDGSFKQFQQ